MSGWRSFVLRLMRVPPEPAPPPGSTPRVFRAARNYFVLRVIGWLIGNLILAIMAILLTAFVVYVMPPDLPLSLRASLTAGAIALLVTFLISVTLGYAVMRLDYELRWYMISDRAIRIREGVLTVREKTIALANIQNTAVNQGPLQRLLGIANVEVRTAGGGGSPAEAHRREGPGQTGQNVGYFRGVDNAPEIRNIIVERTRRHRDAGLGDPDDAEGRSDPAEDLLREVRAIREALENLSTRA
ncbi:MAG TPA: PH domain-containing protein [Thermoanaerobaculia bacterium]|nr:PH domain-containing protein [Thermoanaerobaculia bacterium]